MDVRTLREAAGVGLEEVATAASLSIATLSRVERGERRLSGDAERRVRGALLRLLQARAVAATRALGELVGAEQ